jgi:hypothetical protein
MLIATARSHMSHGDTETQRDRPLSALCSRGGVVHLRGSRVLRVAAALAALLAIAVPPVADAQPVRHPDNGKVFKPQDVDFARPIYHTDFSRPDELADWVREGGRSMRVEDGRLIIESSPADEPGERSGNHVVCWLKREIPADFLLEVVLRPQDKTNGLNIIFFNTRGVNGESIFDPALARRDGNFRQYHSGDLNGYHVSYWAAPRGTTHIRKNRGFHLVAESDLDIIAESPPETFETLRIHKRGEKIRVMVNDRIVVAWDDDGQDYGPPWLHSGWIGLRQMGYTLRTDYDRLTIYPLTAAP